MARAHRFGTVGSKNGRSWWARYTRNAQWHTPGHTFSNADDAWAWLRAEQHLIDRDKWTPPAERRARIAAVAAAAEARESTTLGRYAREWVEKRVTPKGAPLHPRTRGEYMAYLDGILKPLTARPVAAITPTDVAQWHGQHGDTPTLRHAAYSFLKSVLKTAVEVDELLDRNPCRVENANRKPKPATNPDKPVKALTHATVAELANLVQPRDRALILLLAYCCVRSGEACALRRSDLELGIGPDGVPFGWLAVERGISTYDGQRHEGETKTGDKGARTVPVPPHIVGDLEAHLQTWAEPGRDGLLFPSTNPRMAFRTTHQINGRTASYRADGTLRTPGSGWYHAREVAGAPGLHLHWLRHWSTTLWDEAGTPEALRRSLMGHAQPGMTGGYTHPDTTKASPYALRVSELAGWRPPTMPSVTPTTAPAPSSGDAAVLVGVLRSLDDATLAATLAALDAGQITAVMPHLPPERIAAVVANLAQHRSLKG